VRSFACVPLRIWGTAGFKSTTARQLPRDYGDAGKTTTTYVTGFRGAGIFMDLRGAKARPQV
jgi:hypothetical protein